MYFKCILHFFHNKQVFNIFNYLYATYLLITFILVVDEHFWSPGLMSVKITECIGPHNDDNYLCILTLTNVFLSLLKF